MNDIKFPKEQLHKVQIEKSFSVDRFKDDDKLFRFYTGLQDYKAFQILFESFGPVVNNIVYYSGSAGEPESENARHFFSPKGGSWSQVFHAWTEETGDESSLFVSAVLCEEFFGKNRAFYVDVTYKDVDRFRKGSVHEL